jgi:beta-glucosidase
MEKIEQAKKEKEESVSIPDYVKKLEMAIFGAVTPIKQKILNWSLFQDSLRILDVASDITEILNLAKFFKKWPDHTKEILSHIPPQGIFMTGIESSDPFVESRRNQLLEAHNFYENFEDRLQKIYDLGIHWLRFGVPYSQTHKAIDVYDFEFMDKVVKKSSELGITIIADLLHFGLPEWLHQENDQEPYFQNKKFPEEFAKYAAAFAKRYPTIRYFTVVNEPFVTANFSAKIGLWNEKKLSGWQDDRAFVNAVANVARAAILGRLAVEKVFKEEKRGLPPIYVQNESFEKALCAPGSGREKEAERFNLRRFAALDLILGHRERKMRQYLLSQGMDRATYSSFMEMGSKQRAILGIDHYPWCIHTYERDKTFDHNISHPYQLYDLTKEYWDRYGLSLLHTEINAWPEFAGSICLLTYDALSRLRKEGYPVLGMTWYGDEYQVGWHVGLAGPQGYEETPVGLFYKGQKQDVGDLFKDIIQAGFAPITVKRLNFKGLLERYLKLKNNIIK